jgi:hypothetical protein
MHLDYPTSMTYLRDFERLPFGMKLRQLLGLHVQHIAILSRVHHSIAQ